MNFHRLRTKALPGRRDGLAAGAKPFGRAQAVADWRRRFSREAFKRRFSGVVFGSLLLVGFGLVPALAFKESDKCREMEPRI